jgi:spectinomycin phosphotransferase
MVGGKWVGGALGAHRAGHTHTRDRFRATPVARPIDWDTAALAPPERDLWLLDARSGEGMRRYVEASGREPSPAALRLYRLRWQLDDISVFLNVLRSPHRQTADTEYAWRSLAKSMPAGES